MYISVTRPNTGTSFYSNCKNEEDAINILSDLAEKASANKLKSRKVFLKNKLIGAVIDENILYRIEMEYNKL